MPRPKLSHKNAYLKRAKSRFLEGTGCSSPVRAVEKGVKTLGDWAQVLRDELEFDQINRAEDSKTRRKVRRHERQSVRRAPTRELN
jgi:hypothetical protein